MKYIVIIICFLFQSSIGFSQSIDKGNLIDSFKKKSVETAVIPLSNNAFSISEDGSLSIQFQKNKSHFLISAFGNLIEQIQISLIPEKVRIKKSAFNFKELLIMIDNSLQSQWNEVPFVTIPILNNESNSTTQIPNTLFLKLKLAFTL